MIDPDPTFFEYLSTGLTLAWIILASLLVLAGSRIRRQETYIKWWQWGVFFLVGLSLFAFIIASYYVQKSALLLFFESLVVVFSALASAALWLHVRYSSFKRDPETIVVEGIKKLLR